MQLPFPSWEYPGSARSIMLDGGPGRLLDEAIDTGTGRGHRRQPWGPSISARGYRRGRRGGHVQLPFPSWEYPGSARSIMLDGGPGRLLDEAIDTGTGRGHRRQPWRPFISARGHRRGRRGGHVQLPFPSWEYPGSARSIMLDGGPGRLLDEAIDTGTGRGHRRQPWRPFISARGHRRGRRGGHVQLPFPSWECPGNSASPMINGP